MFRIPYAFLGKIEGAEQGSTDLITHLLKKYQIEKIALTRGGNGSVIVTEAGSYEIKASLTHPIVDTVGAGDAFTSILALGYLKKWSVDRTLSLAGYFAGYLCTIEGALPKDDGIYRELMDRMKV